jgi:hypothetical protein
MGLFKSFVRYEAEPSDTGVIGAASRSPSPDLEALMAKATKKKAVKADAVDAALAAPAGSTPARSTPASVPSKVTTPKAAPAPAGLVAPITTPSAGTPTFSSIERDKVMRTYTALKGRRPVSRQDVIESRSIAARVGATALVTAFDKAIKEGHAVPEIPALPVRKAAPAPKPAFAKKAPVTAPASKEAAFSSSEMAFMKNVVAKVKGGAHLPIATLEKAKTIAQRGNTNPRMVAFLDESIVSERMYASLQKGGVKVQRPVATAVAPQKTVPAKVAAKAPPVSDVPPGITPENWSSYKRVLAAVEKGQAVSPLTLEKAQKIALKTGHTESADVLTTALEKASPGRSRLSRPRNLTDGEWALYAPVLLALSAGAAIPTAKLVQARRIAQKSGHSETVSALEEKMSPAARVAIKAQEAKPLRGASPIAFKEPITIKAGPTPGAPKKPLHGALPITAKAAPVGPQRPTDVSPSDWKSYLAVKHALRGEMIRARNTGKKTFITKIPTNSLETAMNVAAKTKDQALVAALTDQFKAKREALAAAKIGRPGLAKVATVAVPIAVATAATVAIAAKPKEAPIPAAPYGVRPVDWKRFCNIKEILRTGKGADVLPYGLLSDSDYELAYALATKTGDSATGELANAYFARSHGALLADYVGMKKTIADISQKKRVSAENLAKATETAKALKLTKTQQSLAAYAKRQPTYDVKIGPAEIEEPTMVATATTTATVAQRGLMDEPMVPTMTAPGRGAPSVPSAPNAPNAPGVSKKEMAFVAAILVALGKNQSVRTKDLMRAQEIAQRAGATEHAEKLAFAISEKRSKEALAAQKIPPPGVAPAPAMVAEVPVSPSKGEIIEAAGAAGVPPALVNTELKKAQEGDPAARANVKAAALTLEEASADNPEAKAKIQEIQAGAKSGDPAYVKAAAGLAAAGAAAGAIELAQSKSAERAKEEVVTQEALAVKAEKKAEKEAEKAKEEVLLEPEGVSPAAGMKAQVAPGEISGGSIALVGAGILGVGLFALARKKKSSGASTTRALAVRR